MRPPYFVPRLTNPRAGVIHQDRDGAWRASNWSGCLGAFVSEEGALEALRRARPRPRRRPHNGDGSEK
jgi:hypothetical protein